MGIPGIIQGFSKLSREDQINLLLTFTHDPDAVANEFAMQRLPEKKLQEIYDGFSENSISDFILPYCIAPNFLIDDRHYFVPMVTEESSVVAAAASAAKFWAERGGFHTRILGMSKPGHIHFTWKGNLQDITAFIDGLKPGLYDVTSDLTVSMQARGGGILDIRLIDLTGTLEGYYQVEVLFNTADSMGANFINSSLERMASFLGDQAEIAGLSDRLSIIMSILSNYTPQCRVECSVCCNTGRLAHPGNKLSGSEFARRFEMAVKMAHSDTSRAVTHNKGIFNGIDAVIIATGNDFRAVEANGHAFASRDGQYRGLTVVDLLRDSFACRIEIPMAIGTTGGVTTLHPLARVSMNILGDPDASRLMSIASAAGLANNFSAIRSLITGGIQTGHMQLHLSNLLLRLGASQEEKDAAGVYFREQNITHAAVSEFLTRLRTRVQMGEK